MAPGPKWPKNGNPNGKMDPQMGFWPDFGHFSILAAIFRLFQAWGHFPFSLPFFRDFCSGPVSHSVNGHFNRKEIPSFFCGVTPSKTLAAPQPLNTGFPLGNGGVLRSEEGEGFRKEGDVGKGKKEGKEDAQKVLSVAKRSRSSLFWTLNFRVFPCLCISDVSANQS